MYQGMNDNSYGISGQNSYGMNDNVYGNRNQNDRFNDPDNDGYLGGSQFAGRKKTRR